MGTSGVSCFALLIMGYLAELDVDGKVPYERAILNIWEMEGEIGLSILGNGNFMDFCLDAEHKQEDGIGMVWNNHWKLMIVKRESGWVVGPLAKSKCHVKCWTETITGNSLPGGVTSPVQLSFLWIQSKSKLINVFLWRGPFARQCREEAKGRQV